MTHFSTFSIPSEVIEGILCHTDPVDVAAFSQTSKAYHDVVYNPDDQKLWRELYLKLPLDDPRECINTLGKSQRGLSVDWKTELQDFVRASQVVMDQTRLREGELITILQTLIRLATHFKSLQDGKSSNLQWITKNLLRGSNFLRYGEQTVLSPGEEAMMAKLRILAGCTEADYATEAGNKSRAYVYDLGNYSAQTGWGPFRDPFADSTNWRLLRAVHHLISIHVKEPNELIDEVPPYAMLLQGPEPPMPEFSGDWAGIEGPWHGWCIAANLTPLSSHTYSVVCLYGP
jgi:hypothetical protein